MTNWDIRFLLLAEHISGWSKDPTTKCGAVIVRDDHSVVSMGYNGFPKMIKDAPELLESRVQKLQRVIHAEMNALLFMRGENVTSRHTLYTWPFLSCHRCAVHVIQAGIGRVVAPLCTKDRWQDSIDLSKLLFKEAMVEVLEIEDEELEVYRTGPGTGARNSGSGRGPLQGTIQNSGQVAGAGGIRQDGELLPRSAGRT